jgi:hypothetical protein
VRKTKFTWANSCTVAAAPYISLSTRCPSSPEAEIIFREAWFKHQIVDKLENGESAVSVVDVLQEQTQAQALRGDDGKVTYGVVQADC